MEMLIKQEIVYSAVITIVVIIANTNNDKSNVKIVGIKLKLNIAKLVIMIAQYKYMFKNSERIETKIGILTEKNIAEERWKIANLISMAPMRTI